MSRKKDRAIAYGAKMHKEGANFALYCVARQFAVESRDIRISDKTVAEKAEALAERILETERDTLAREIGRAAEKEAAAG